MKKLISKVLFFSLILFINILHALPPDFYIKKRLKNTFLASSSSSSSTPDPVPPTTIKERVAIQYKTAMQLLLTVVDIIPENSNYYLVERIYRYHRDLEISTDLTGADNKFLQGVEKGLVQDIKLFEYSLKELMRDKYSDLYNLYLHLD